MASQMMQVSEQVHGTTEAVVSMQSAVIATEIQSAQEICSNVNRGFFTLVRSQISQKIAQNQSRVEALLMKMEQQKRLLLNVKANMEREYGRIAARYLTLFSRINKELEQRIRQVDQPVFELVGRHMTTASNRMNALTSWMLTSQTECLGKSQQMLMSNLKNNAQRTLERSVEYLEDAAQQRALSERILVAREETEVAERCVPAVVCELQNDASQIAQTHVHLPQMLQGHLSQQVGNVVRSHNDLPWRTAQKADQTTVDEAFARLMQKANLPERVKAEMIRLRQRQAYQTL